MRFFDQREQVLTASWTPPDGARVTFTDMPEPWSAALERLGRDLVVRHYGGDVVHIDWVVMYDPVGGTAWLSSSITVAGKRARGLSGNGYGAHLDDDVEKVLVSMADLVQNEVAEVGTAWPWGDDGGFMNPALVDGVAVWRDRQGRTVRIGDLSEQGYRLRK
ncbi:MAG: hypothetical protein WBQ44_11445 [Rhodococcus sp. (in: high G+C Gram-positive bacteria)]